MDDRHRRLQALIDRIEQRGPRRLTPAPPAATAITSGARARSDTTLVRRETAVGPCSYREVCYTPGASAGRQRLDALAALEPDSLALLVPGEALDAVAPHELLFLDIETTGLGGAGAMAFLVATARMEADGVFVLRQYLARSPAEEGALLTALIEDARPDRDPVLVTYNGRGFDAPMLDGRMTMHRLRAGFEALRHVDLLTVSRLLYRGLLRSCRLAEVEVAVLGLERPGDEVPGAEVPAWYFRFLRTGDDRCLAPLIRHNEVDVVALGGLLARLSALATGAERPAHGVEGLALARLLARRARPLEAAAHLEQALRTLAPSHARDEALHRLAMHHKRSGQRPLAVPLWAELASRPGHGRVHAQVELAKYYEHERRDFAAAASVVAEALALVAAGAAAERDRRLDELTHRQSRVRRKAGRPQAAEAAPRA